MSSRSRAHSSGAAMGKEDVAKLDESLNVFRNDRFDAENHVQSKCSLNEKDLFEDVGPLLSMKLGSKTLDGVHQVFNSYANMLIKALPNSIEEEANFDGTGNKIVRMAENESQQIALLANASLSAEDLLPRVATKLSPANQLDYKDDPPRRNADRYNRNSEQREWKRRLLNRMASIGTKMFVGKERFVTLLLMRLTEKVILFLSNNQSFWDDIEEGPNPLRSLGLQQLFLDMRFVMHFSNQGRYLSRNLHRVINEVITKAMQAFAATGVDPDSVLPEDTFFGEICLDVIERLSGKPKAIIGDRDLNSPTASVSAQSVSSVRSHGSS